MSDLKVTVFSILTVLFISSCSTTTVEEDLEEYCDCIEGVKSGLEIRECLILAQEMLEKYSSDPKSAEYIKEHIDGCGTPDM